ncbi:MAG TPA: hypothetical protein VIL46_05390 [Gemmataceae bacterium]
MTAARPSLPADRLPLVVGVTGHSDVSEGDLPRLRRCVEEFFDLQRRRYPDTPLAVLSALNEGAERLATRAALERGIPLIAVLPRARGEHLAAIADPDSRQELEKLLDRAALVVELAGASPSEVSAFLVRHNQVLLCMWDARPGREPGTPAEVVHFQECGPPPPGGPTGCALEAADGGLVHPVITPRAGGPEPLGRTFSTPERPWGGKEDGRRRAARAVYRQVCKNINEFNRDTEPLRSRLAPARGASGEYLLPEARRRDLPSVVRGPVEALLNRYATADALALYFQRKVRLWQPVLFAVAFLAAYAFYLSYLHPEWRWARLGYPAVAGAGFLAYQWVRWRRYQSKYLDYRGLAEALRVQFFWRLGGVGESAAENYLPLQWSDLRWIRAAVRTCDLLAGGQRPPAGEAVPGRWSLLHDHWVADQRDYFDRRGVPRDEAKLLRLRACAWALIAFGGLWVLWRGLGGPVGWLPGPDEAVPRWLGLGEAGANAFHYLSVLFGLGTVGGFLILTYIRSRGLQEHLKQYKRMREIYRAAGERLAGLIERQPADDAEAEALVLRLGREALAENAHWVLLHRDRPIEVPRVL